MGKWQRTAVTALLLAEMVVTLLPVLQDFAGDQAERPAERIRQAVRVAVCTVLLMTSCSALAPVWLRPNATSWLITFGAVHVAAAGLGWAHGLPVLTLTATAALVCVPALVLAPRHRGE